MLSRRLRRRLVRHHVVIALVAGVALLTTYALVASKNPDLRWSMATAYGNGLQNGRAP